MGERKGLFRRRQERLYLRNAKADDFFDFRASRHGLTHHFIYRVRMSIYCYQQYPAYLRMALASNQYISVFALFVYRMYSLRRSVTVLKGTYNLSQTVFGRRYSSISRFLPCYKALGPRVPSARWFSTSDLNLEDDYVNPFLQWIIMQIDPDLVFKNIRELSKTKRIVPASITSALQNKSITCDFEKNQVII